MKPISAAIAITAALAGVGIGNSYAATSADPNGPRENRPAGSA